MMKNIFDVSACAGPQYSRDELLRLYWYGHPRFRFIKSRPINSRLLDIGAGAGGLAFWKQWEQPDRSDLRFYGIDLSVGEHAALYEKFDSLNLDSDKLPYEDNFFDAAYSTHVLEHLHHPEETLAEVLRVTKSGGYIYLETPNHNSLDVPTCEEFERHGFVTSTMNFYDDRTHLRPYSSSEIEHMFYHEGVETFEQGTIQNPYLEEILIDYGHRYEDKEMTTYGFWLKSHWSDYVWLRKK